MLPVSGESCRVPLCSRVARPPHAQGTQAAPACVRSDDRWQDALAEDGGRVLSQLLA